MPCPSIALSRRLDRSTDPTMSASRPRQVDIPTVPSVPAPGEHTRRLSPFRERSSTTSPAPTSGSGTTGSVDGRVVRSPERTGASPYAAERRMRENRQRVHSAPLARLGWPLQRRSVSDDVPPPAVRALDGFRTFGNSRRDARCLLFSLDRGALGRTTDTPHSPDRTPPRRRPGGSCASRLHTPPAISLRRRRTPLLAA